MKGPVQSGRTSSVMDSSSDKDYFPDVEDYDNEDLSDEMEDDEEDDSLPIPLSQSSLEEPSISVIEGIGLCDGFEHTAVGTDIGNDLARHSKQVTETDLAEAISKHHISNAVNESPLTTSSPSPILTSPASSSPFLPSSQARGYEWSQHAMKRR